MSAQKPVYSRPSDDEPAPAPKKRKRHHKRKNAAPTAVNESFTPHEDDGVTKRDPTTEANTTITDNAVLNTIDMADRDTARTEFARVCEYLHGQRELDARLISSMARMLSMRLAVRDALIIAAIRPDMVDADAMAAFAFEPHEPRTATLMGRLLSGAFDTGDGYDAETLDRFDTLVGEAGHEPDAPDAHGPAHPRTTPHRFRSCGIRCSKQRIRTYECSPTRAWAACRETRTPWSAKPPDHAVGDGNRAPRCGANAGRSMS